MLRQDLRRWAPDRQGHRLHAPRTERSGSIDATDGAQALVALLAAKRVASLSVSSAASSRRCCMRSALAQRIRYVGIRHEAAGAMMAAAVFAGSGRVAVALGEMGPGGLNLASGAGVAFNNNLAVLLITTNQHRAAAYPHAGMFMDLDTRACSAPLTKWNAVVHDRAPHAGAGAHARFARR